MGWHQLWLLCRQLRWCVAASGPPLITPHAEGHQTGLNWSTNGGHQAGTELPGGGWGKARSPWLGALCCVCPPCSVWAVPRATSCKSLVTVPPQTLYSALPFVGKTELAEQRSNAMPPSYSRWDPWLAQDERSCAGTGEGGVRPGGPSEKPVWLWPRNHWCPYLIKIHFKNPRKQQAT